MTKQVWQYNLCEFTVYIATRFKD